MLEKLKMLLGTPEEYDPVIEDSIKEARADLFRSGVKYFYCEECAPEPLIGKAIETYVMAQLSTDRFDAERYQKSYVIQMDNLRKSTIYGRFEEDC